MNQRAVTAGDRNARCHRKPTGHGLDGAVVFEGDIMVCDVWMRQTLQQVSADDDVFARLASNLRNRVTANQVTRGTR